MDPFRTAPVQPSATVAQRLRWTEVGIMLRVGLGSKNSPGRVGANGRKCVVEMLSSERRGAR